MISSGGYVKKRNGYRLPVFHKKTLDSSMYLNGHPARPVFIEDMGKSGFPNFPVLSVFSHFHTARFPDVAMGFCPMFFGLSRKTVFREIRMGKSGRKNRPDCRFWHKKRPCALHTRLYCINRTVFLQHKKPLRLRRPVCRIPGFADILLYFRKIIPI